MADDGGLHGDYTVINDTGHKVVIRELMPSCACSEVRVDKHELEPGEQAILHIHADLKGRTGAQYFHCAIVFAGDEEPWELLIQTIINQPFSVQPREVHFGLIDPNSETTAKVVLEMFQAPGKKAITLISCDSASNQLTVSSDPAKEDVSSNGERRVYQAVHLKLAPQFSNGSFNSSVLATYVQDGQTRELAIPVTWSVRNPFAISPPRVFFGKVDPDVAKTDRRVSVRRADGKHFAIRSVQSTKPEIVCATYGTGSADEHVIVLTLTAPKQSAFLSGEVIVETDNAVLPKLVIPFAAAPQ